MSFPRPSSDLTVSQRYSDTASKRADASRWPRRLVAGLLALTGLLAFAYAGISTYGATRVVAQSRMPITQTPAALGLAFREVTFPSRYDHLLLDGWFIPGLLPTGRLTAQRTIIVVHGNSGNRMDPTVGILDLSGEFVHHGFAVLAFDLRGLGESTAAPLSLGYFEQRDVLGAVDFLRSGPVPYPELGRPRSLAGWGISMGAQSLLLAAAREPAIQAIVADCPYVDMAPIVEREILKHGHLPAALTPGVLLADRILYGIDFYDIRAVDVVASIAPRPLFFIIGDHDDFDPPSNVPILAQAASSAPNAHVQSWLAPGVYHHARSFKVDRVEYVRRVIAFYEASLGPDTSAGA